jgi:DNA-binding FadR family transcriptional regulator
MTIAFAPISNDPAYRLVAQSIEQKILSGELPVGQALPSELDLASQLKVNRSTVREAIRLLEQNGLVRRRHGAKKLLVTIPGLSGLSKRLRTTMIMQQLTFRELWEVMMALEPMAAEAAARNATPELLARLEENLAQTRAALSDTHRLTELDIEFHDLIVQASGNRALTLSHDAISNLFYPRFLEVFARLNAGERLLMAHEKVFEAIVARDQREARRWMEKHIADFKRGYEVANLDLEDDVASQPYFPLKSERAVP